MSTPTSRRRVRRRIVAITIAVTASLATACSTSTTTTPGAPVSTTASDDDLTRDAAQARMFDHFTQALTGVPAGVSLGQDPPKPDLQAQLPGVIAPCDDNNTVPDSPVNLQVAFWVQGITDGAETQTYQALVQAFRDASWSVVPDPAYPDEVTRAYTPDGYAVVAQLNAKGGLSLTGSSPCFPPGNAATTTPQPTAIPHPAS